MATQSAATTFIFDQTQRKVVPKSKRKLQKHLRSAGLAYISRTGKLIPAKKVADELCQCPQKCDERVPRSARERLFYHFYGLGDADAQNQFLRQNMDLRARLNIPETTETGRMPRRITCKYLVPLLPSSDHVEVCQKAFVSAFVITTKRVRLQREKLISSLGLNSYSSHNRNKETNNNNVETNTTNNNTSTVVPSNERVTIVENNNNNNNNNEPKKPAQSTNNNLQLQHSQQRLFQEKKKKKTSIDYNDPLLPFGLLLPDGVTIAPVTMTPDHDRDIAIVNNFFSNQLWKPEYIGTYS